jgi:predicted GTPase
MQEVAAPRRRRILILGAAGRDFHNFNTVYRTDAASEVLAFTAAQIPGIAGRRYPPSLAGPLYPDGIPIEDESQLEALVRERQVDEVVFSYSDVPHTEVMHIASRVLAAGADFCLFGPRRTMLAAQKPVVAVSAVRTGAGKSQISRWLSRRLVEQGLRVAVLRHPMPYGELERQAVQRFATEDDMVTAQCTLEEREEYEPHLAAGNTVFAGVDYARIVEAAEREADILLWDGGNNDFPFIRPDLHIVLVDPMRPGHETGWHPGEAVLRMADLVVISKTGSASAEAIGQVEAAARALAPTALLCRADSAIRLDPEMSLAGKRVIVVEDGPTLTHGGMSTGAGWIAARAAGATDFVDPRQVARGAIASVFARYPHIGTVLPATGYSEQERRDLGATIEAADADFVVAGTPIDLERVLDLRTPVLRARYEHREVPGHEIWPAIQAFLDRLGRAAD